MGVDGFEGGAQAFAAFAVERADRAAQAVDRFGQFGLFGHRAFTMGGVVAFIYGMALFGSTYLVPVFMQIALKLPPSQAGAVLLSGGLPGSDGCVHPEDDVVCFGDLLIDFVPTVTGTGLADAPAFVKAPGGAAANADVVITSGGVSVGEPEHEMFRDSFRTFLERHVAPHHDQWEADKLVDRSVWVEAGKQGFLGMAVPEEYGGGGDSDFRYNTIVCEESAAGRYSGLGFALHNDVIAPYLLHQTNEEQKQRWLPKFCTGEMITAIAMTEPGTGSDLQGIKTRAVREGDHYVLNGSKTFITNGINADLVIVVAQTNPEKGAQGFSLLGVERGMAGFERGRHLDKVGLDAQDTAELFFTDLRVPAGNLLGGEGNGFAMLMTQLSQERLIQAIRGVASSEAAIGWTQVRDITVSDQHAPGRSRLRCDGE